MLMVIIMGDVDMEELKPCRCGEDINESFQIEMVWRGRGMDVAVAYCKYCKNVVPFKIGAWEMNRAYETAANAWNAQPQES